MRFLFLLLFLAAGTAHAQKTAVAGKIRLKDSILNGYINVLVFDETPQEFEFSERPQGPYRLFSAADIHSVELQDGSVFEKYAIGVFVDARDHLYRTAETYAPEKQVKGQMMVQKLVSGTYSLYVFADASSFSHFFYRSETDSVLTPPTYQVYVEESTQIIHTNAGFRNEINFLVTKTGCRKISAIETARMPYNRLALMKAFKQINSCTGSTTSDLYTRQNRLVPHVEIAAGVIWFQFQRENFQFNKSPQWGSNMKPTVSARLLLSPRQKSRGYGFGVMLQYQQSGGVSHPLALTSYDTAHLNYEFRRIGITPYYRHYLSNGRIRPFIELGVTFIREFEGVIEFKSVYRYERYEEQFRKALVHTLLGFEMNRAQLQFQYSPNLLRNERMFALQAGFKVL